MNHNYVPSRFSQQGDNALPDSYPSSRYFPACQPHHPGTTFHEQGAGANPSMNTEYSTSPRPSSLPYTSSPFGGYGTLSMISPRLQQDQKMPLSQNHYQHSHEPMGKQKQRLNITPASAFRPSFEGSISGVSPDGSNTGMTLDGLKRKRPDSRGQENENKASGKPLLGRKDSKRTKPSMCTVLQDETSDMREIISTYQMIRSRLPELLQPDGPRESDLIDALKLAMDGFKLVASSNTIPNSSRMAASRPRTWNGDGYNARNGSSSQARGPTHYAHTSVSTSASDPLTTRNSTPSLYTSSSVHSVTSHPAESAHTYTPPSSTSPVRLLNGENFHPAGEMISMDRISTDCSSKTTCLGCGATETPEWRRGPYGPRTLCNACGLVFAKLVRKRAKEVVKVDVSAQDSVKKPKPRKKKTLKNDVPRVEQGELLISSNC